MNDAELKKRLTTVIDLQPWSHEQQRAARALVPYFVKTIQSILADELRKAKGKPVQAD